MKPIPDAMYHSVVKMGMYCPMAAEKEGNTMLSFPHFNQQETGELLIYLL